MEIGRVIFEYVLFNSNLVGLYHLSADPINKCDLLVMIKNIYKTNILLINHQTLSLLLIKYKKMKYLLSKL